MTPDQIAKVCHEANRAITDIVKDVPVQPRWEEAPEDQRSSCLAGVQFHLANPEAGASASHDAWMQHKLEAGWKWGPLKDAEKKEHPALVLFSELSEPVQKKDALFRAVVHALK